MSTPSTPWAQHLETTADGSYTFFSPDFQETFHSRGGARSEAIDKFVGAAALPQRAQGDRLVLLDVCYGLGYNTAAALEVIWQVNPRCHVTLVGVEIDPSIPLAALAPEILSLWSPAVVPVLQELVQYGTYVSENCEAILYGEDARTTVQRLNQQGFTADAIFLDPFSPRRCPQLWTVEFLTGVARCLAPEGKLTTYCRAAAVRSALQDAGLVLGTLPVTGPALPHEWANGTIAAHPHSQAAQSLTPLSASEREHLQTRAGIPYRDPTLAGTATDITARRSAEQRGSDRESTTQWRKRWGIE
jgi:tRNA U34 5-methylaminomethyl-2-thiouridine-forming methyltransferase MnmC